MMTDDQKRLKISKARVDAVNLLLQAQHTPEIDTEAQLKLITEAIETLRDLKDEFNAHAWKEATLPV